jgi:hypothetical protein
MSLLGGLSSAGRRLFTLLAAILSVLGATSAVADAQSAPGRVYFSQTSYTAHENEGELSITIARGDDSVAEQVRYGVRHVDAEPGLDFDTVGNTLAQLRRASRRTPSTSRSSIVA